MLLSTVNSHPRDDNITFKEENHEYTIKGMNRRPISVTSLIHKYFPEFDSDAVIKKMMNSARWKQSKYYGQTAESIKQSWDLSGKNAAHQGTLMHKSIEDFLNGEPVENSETKEFGMFQSFWNDLLIKYPSLRPYRTEWIIYDEDVGVAGSIDCVLSDANGNLVILDWKRSKEIKIENRYEKGTGPFCNYDNCNYSHYSLQLNFYRTILEKNYGKKVIFMMLVVLHPDQPSYVCHPIQNIDLSNAWETINS